MWQREHVATSISDRHHTAWRGATGRQRGFPQPPPPRHMLSRVVGEETTIVSMFLYHHSSVLCMYRDASVC
jgi:hypothetical protein